MPNIRIVTGGAIFCGFLLVSGMSAGDAAAQTAATDTPGKPIQLLQLLQPSAAKAAPRAKLAAKPVAKSSKTRIASRRKVSRHTRVAERKRHAPAQIAEAREQATPAAGVWPAAPSAPPAEVAAAEPAPQARSAPAETAPSELVVGGHAVQVASPNDANDIDLAANDANAQVQAAPPSIAAASAPAMSEVTPPAPKSDSIQAATAQSPQSSEVGSASWILQVLAALGGAVAAGSVAWFLIGSAPQRTYG